jgi:anaerobic magnesium-protoporphyrin IX monomethyl ester cyclase
LNNVDILLIGFEDQENLGLRYIASYLKKHDIQVEIVPCQFNQKENLLSYIRERNPKIVGVSLIFQRMFFDFKDLISYLRKNGINSHFTIGGHFPSLECLNTLKLIPELDSVIRFEGEETLRELYENLDYPDRWKGIKSLAFRKGDNVYVNSPRPLIKDLDSLPFPLRNAYTATHRGLGICSILGSRGCYYDCSFCSIHQFYREPPGPLRRTRSPSNIIREMKQLFHEKNIHIFIFQDDEWFMKGHHHIKWLENFIMELEKSEIANKILWRISCRIDDVNARLIKKMKDVGLMCVYLGIESGNNRGLQTFNKHFTVGDIYRAIETLNEIDMPFEFGFMIFDPDSTFESIHENIKLLEKITDGGQAIAHFSKMVPYAGTLISKRLERERKLGGTIASPDYNFNDERLHILQFFSSNVFNFRNFHEGGLVERLRTAKFDSIVMKKFFSDRYDVDAYENRVKTLIQQSNDSALETLSIATNFMKNRTEKEIYAHWPLLEQISLDEQYKEELITSSLDELEGCFS